MKDYKKVIYFKLDICLKKVSRDAGVRLCNLKRRSGFNVNVFPPKWPALFDAKRQAKVNNIETALHIRDLFAVSSSLGFVV